MVFHRKVTVPTQAMQVLEAFAGILETLADELIGFEQCLGIGKELGVDSKHAVAHSVQCLFPAAVLKTAGEQAVYAGLAIFLVLQQLVGHAAVGRDNENALVGCVAIALTENNAVTNGGVIAH